MKFIPWDEWMLSDPQGGLQLLGYPILGGGWAPYTWSWLSIRVGLLGNSDWWATYSQVEPSGGPVSLGV